jgi:hypothetical protein
MAHLLTLSSLLASPHLGYGVWRHIKFMDVCLCVVRGCSGLVAAPLDLGCLSHNGVVLFLLSLCP